jgi:MauM/NapG family ferredoxin protein
MAGGVMVGAVAGAGYRTARAARAPDPLLRPPGAGTEHDFLAACIRCGQCVEACPYDTLNLATLAQGTRAGTPYVVPRDVPCYLCTDHDEPQCIAACPTPALTPVDDVRDVRMGTARIDETICLAFNDTVCRACWHACPFPDEAIGLNARLRPVVHTDACTGCGLCERACPTEPRSIVIEPAAGEEA